MCDLLNYRLDLIVIAVLLNINMKDLKYNDIESAIKDYILKIVNKYCLGYFNRFGFELDVDLDLDFK